MKKRFYGFALGALLLALSFPADAQQPGKIPRIGVVSGFGTSNYPGSNIKIFRQALQELGYFEGKNIRYEYRFTEGIGTAPRESSPNL